MRARQKQFIVKKDHSHNGEVLGDADVLLAMLRMFDLPDYCFTDLAVPAEHLHAGKTLPRAPDDTEDGRSAQSTRDTDDDRQATIDDVGVDAEPARHARRPIHI